MVGITCRYPGKDTRCEDFELAITAARPTFGSFGRIPIFLVSTSSDSLSELPVELSLSLSILCIVVMCESTLLSVLGLEFTSAILPESHAAHRLLLLISRLAYLDPLDTIGCGPSVRLRL